jgi:DNA mismatch endonuclease, patch repair protein
VDVLTSEQRRLCMSRNKGRDTKPERALRLALWRMGFRYRLHAKLPGKPDMVFASRRVAVFVDGCFWHGCPQHGAKPKTNAAFWEAKLARNRERDRQVNDLLRSNGWTIIRIWEHQVRNDLDSAVARLAQLLDPGLPTSFQFSLTAPRP